jgi:N-acetylglucosaminyldiphosphoundecaprenol N-acetyl-beta-D-mannosaminyltransferase
MTIIGEAKTMKSDDKTGTILGVQVSGTSKTGLLREITDKINKNAHTKPFFIVTAYSEFFLEAAKDPDLAKALTVADKVIPDGVSVPAAADYLKLRSGNMISDVRAGLGIGLDILQGKYHNRTIVGVELTKKILETARTNHWKVFILGGQGQSAKKVISIYGGNIGSYQEKPVFEREMKIGNRNVLRMIDEFKPDIMFVAFGRFKAEKWVAENVNRIEAKVILGVGSSLDELAGDGPWATAVPVWEEKMGLKWLWRATKDPKHLRRAWNAFPVFAWKVFRSP